MEDGLLKEFSDRADKAEKRLEYIEKTISGGSNGHSTQAVALSQRYIEELQALRIVLMDAKEDQERLERRVVELETINTKLCYQIKHLKRAVMESDTQPSAVP